MSSHLDDVTALKLATPFKMRLGIASAPDPCPKIPPSLLSADHIIEYVSKTGMIAPFDGNDFAKSPLKAASYESKIGKYAYIFERGINYPVTIFDGTQEYLEVPANSIVFVESDIYFRLPPFIAVRFNLQINHVHRGLLLGTGPLVDPGFWGKLCIPLHNLTNEPYLISKDDGFVWIEFTKTSSTPKSGRPPSNTEFPNIKKFIEKASKPIVEDAAPIPIRSSIPDMVEEANRNSEEAATAAKKSADDAASAKSDAKGAIDQADKMRSYNFFAMIAAAFALLSICVAFLVFLTNLSNRNEEIAEKLSGKTEEMERALRNHVEEVDSIPKKSSEHDASMPFLRSQIQSQNEDLDKLRKQLNSLNLEIALLKPKLCDRNRPDIRCP